MNLRLGDLGERVARLQSHLLQAGYTVSETHVFDIETQAAVAHFQHAHGLVADGIVGVRTRGALARALQARTTTPKRVDKKHATTDRKLLSDTHLIAAATSLNVPITVIRAIHEVESRSAGFLSDGRPAILFERHVFFRRLRRHGIDPTPHAKHYPGLVSMKPGGYRGGTGEHIRLSAASRIHADAAQESASWGAFQIMGYHWATLGYESLKDFIARMHRHESDHLEAFVRFIKADSRLHRALTNQEWARFARGYNGPAYAANLYDTKLAQAHARYVALETRLA